MKARPQTLRIGEVAQQGGLTVEALRYYERMGLLPHPPRSTGGLRRYHPDVLDRVRFIKQAQTLGLSLNEIQQLTGNARQKGRGACQRVHDVLARHIADIDKRAAELRELRKTLERYRKTCEQALVRETEPGCPTLDALERTHA
jgi:MerR family transcriptional regulator, copper efflux regulator